MKTFDFINYTIDHLFSTNNERQVLKAFFYRVTLNWNVDEVAKELGVTQIKVNLLTRSVDSYILRKEGFKEPYLKAKKDIERVASYNVSKRHTKHLRKVANRFEGNHRLLTINERIC